AVPSSVVVQLRLSIFCTLLRPTFAWRLKSSTQTTTVRFHRAPFHEHPSSQGKFRSRSFKPSLTKPGIVAKPRLVPPPAVPGAQARQTPRNRPLLLPQEEAVFHSSRTPSSFSSTLARPAVAELSNSSSSPACSKSSCCVCVVCCSLLFACVGHSLT